MSRKSSQINRTILIDQLGTKCCNCGKECHDLIIYHHIVPISLGGKDIITNIVPICTECHNILHHGISEDNHISHSELIKAAIKKQKESGTYTGGRKKTTLEDIPDQFFDYLNKIKNNEITKTEAARKLNCSRSTIYKYLQILEK